ncbi:MAG: hypothetical protein ACRYG6_08615 [Janthinobacterium lividum]
MIRLLPRPALLTSVVVAVSVAGGMAFGVATVAAALALRASVGGRRP